MPRSPLLPRRLVALVAIALAVGCRSASTDFPYDRERDRDRGRWGDRIVVDAGVLPALWLRVDRDDDAAASDEVDTMGPGYSARLGLGNTDQSIGILYHGAFTEEDDGEAEIDLHAIYLDFDASIPIEPDPGLMFVHAAAGVGLVHLDSPDTTLDTTTGAVNLRLQLEVRPTSALHFFIGAGGFAFGHPGESNAYGTFADLGLRLSF